MTTTQLSRLVIYGSRKLDISVKFIDEMIRVKYPSLRVDTVISGNSGDVDLLGEVWAENNGRNIELFPAEWGKYGKGAGPMRNQKMAIMCTHALGFWNGSSKGTANMCSWLAVYNKPNKVILV